MVVIVEIAIMPEVEIPVNIKDMLLLLFINVIPFQMYYFYKEKTNN